MEKNLTIKVDDRLIDLINEVEKDLSSGENAWRLPILWSFGETGISANGWGNYIEFDLAVGESPRGEWKSVVFREIGKHDNENWETHPLDSDYEVN